MENEKLQILKMVQEGKITPEEAARLLQAVDSKPAVTTTSSGNGKWIRIRVQEHGRQIVNVNLPLSLVEVAISMGLKFVPEEELRGVDVNALMEAIRQGVTGKIVEIDADEHKVEIIVE